MDKDFRQSYWLALQFWVQPNRIFTVGVPQASHGKIGHFARVNSVRACCLCLALTEFTQLARRASLKGGPTIPAHWWVFFTQIVAKFLQLLSAILIRFFTFLFVKKYSHRSRNSLAFLYFFYRHLLGCMKQLSLPSNYYLGGVENE